jgi:hypothetical protein
MPGQRFFQIQNSGTSVDDRAYPSLAQATLGLDESPKNSEVVEIDVWSNVVRRYSSAECLKARKAFLHPLQ